MEEWERERLLHGFVLQDTRDKESFKTSNDEPTPPIKCGD